MILQKKAQMLEFLMRLGIALIIIFLVIIPLYGKIKPIIFGPTLTEESVKEIANEIDKIEFESKPIIIKMEKSSAIVGFGKDKDFQCFGCGNNIKGQLSSFMKRPNLPECRDSSCICSCKNPPSSPTGTLLEITCELKCTRINYDIYPNIKAGEIYVKKIGSLGYAYGNSEWKGGFFYIRDTGEMDIVMSGIRKNFDISTELFLEKKKIGDTIYIALCPSSDCINEEP